MKQSQRWFGENLDQAEKSRYANYRVFEATGPNAESTSPRGESKKRFIVGRTKVGEEAYVG